VGGKEIAVRPKLKVGSGGFLAHIFASNVFLTKFF
jgi:hypothetical protein